MKISIAQTRPIKGDVSGNIEKHTQLIKMAVSLTASSIFFPELSITGYEPGLAKKLATSQDDTRFLEFQSISDTENITIGFGAPTQTAKGILISMIIIQPHNPRQTYSKQQIHSDECPYFINGEGQILISVDGLKIAPGICYESLQPEHSDYACELGAEIYIASVAKTQNGIDKGMIHYPLVAKKHAIPVLMANCLGVCDGSLCVGNSSIWSKSGELICQLDNEREGLILFDTETEKVSEHYLSKRFN